MREVELFCNDVGSMQVVEEANAPVHQSSTTIVEKGGQVQQQFTQINMLGSTVPVGLTEDYLKDFQHAIARENWGDAGKIIRPLIQNEAYKLYETERKKAIGCSYFSYCWLTSSFQEAKDWYENLPVGDAELKELAAWNALLTFEFSDNSATKEQARNKILGALLSYPDSPTIQAIGIDSRDQELSERASNNIAPWLSDENITCNPEYFYSFSSLSTYAFNLGDFELSRRAIQPLHNAKKTGVNSLKVSLLLEHINLKEMLSDNSVVQGVHIPIAIYKALVPIEAKLQSIVDAAEAESYIYVNAIDSLASVNNLLYKPNKAIELYEHLDMQDLPLSCYTNLLNCYQEVGDYKAAIELIESLPVNIKDHFSHFYTVALVNMGDWDKARELQPEGVPESYFFDPSSTVLLEDIESFHYASQIAVNRYRNGDESDKKRAVAYLEAYKPENVSDQLSKATSLCHCDNYQAAIKIFDEAFKDIGAGFGPAFCNFMTALEKNKNRREMKIWYAQFDKDAPIEAYLPLKFIHLNFIHTTQSSKKLKKAIETVLDKIDDSEALPFKIYWMQLNRQEKGWGKDFNDRIKVWGMNPKGSLSDQITYLTILSHSLSSNQVLPEWYKLIHKYPRKGDVLEAYVGVVLSYITLDENLSWEEYDKVTNSSAVELSDGSRLVIDDKLCNTSRNSETYSSDDELATDLIGKKVGDIIFNDVLDGVKITAIYSPFLWAYKFAQQELPKSSYSR